MFTELQYLFFPCLPFALFDTTGPLVVCDASWPHLYSQGSSKGGYRLQQATFEVLYFGLATSPVASKQRSKQQLKIK